MNPSSSSEQLFTVTADGEWRLVENISRLKRLVAAAVSLPSVSHLIEIALLCCSCLIATIVLLPSPCCFHLCLAAIGILLLFPCRWHLHDIVASVLLPLASCFCWRVFTITFLLLVLPPFHFLLISLQSLPSVTRCQSFPRPAVVAVVVVSVHRRLPLVCCCHCHLIAVVAFGVFFLCSSHLSVFTINVL